MLSDLEALRLARLAEARPEVRGLVPDREDFPCHSVRGRGFEVATAGGSESAITFAIGLSLGYPVCCILDFIADYQHSRYSAVMRARHARPYFVVCRRHDVKGA